jgi:chromosome segregation ATPase
MEEIIKNKKVQMAAIVLLVAAIFFLLYSLIGIPDLPKIIHDWQIDHYQSRLARAMADKKAAEKDLAAFEAQLPELVVAADRGDIPDAVLSNALENIAKKKQELQDLEQKINKYEKNLVYAVDKMI